MGRFIVRRLLLTIPTVLGVTVVVFLTVKLIPGNPVAALAGASSTPASRAALTHSLGLDRALPIQYFDWLRNFVTGNFGTSIARQQPVRPMVMSAFENTLVLALAGAVVAGAGGLVLGGVGALWRRKGVGRAASAFSAVSVSAPQYSVALLLLIFLSVSHPIFPSGGMHNPTGGGGFASLLDHLVLPAVAAGLAPMGVIARMFRSSLLEVLGQDFVSNLRARGLSRARVMWHAVHNTVPTLFTVAGLQLGFLLGGVIFVETIFSWPGLGELVYSAISERDFPVIEGGAFVIAVALVLLNLLADVGHAAVDPRVRS